MTMRRQIALAMHANLPADGVSNEDPDCELTGMIDAVLDIIAEPSATIMADVDQKIHPNWLVRMAFNVMIRAIKEGK